MRCDAHVGNPIPETSHNNKHEENDINSDICKILQIWWRGGATGKALDLRSTGRGFILLRAKAA